MKKLLILLFSVAVATTVSAQLPSVGFLGSDITGCEGGTGLGFNGSEPFFNPNWTYLWSTGETTSQIFYPTFAGYQTVWCKVSLNGQSVTDTIHFTVLPPVTLAPLQTTAANSCVDSAVISTPLVTGYTYQWYHADPNNAGNYLIINGATSNTYLATTSDLYQVKVTNAGGCFDYAQLQVYTLGKPKPFLHDTVLCQTLTSSTITMSDNVNTGCTYSWNTGSTSNNLSFNIANAIGLNTSIVTITNSGGCSIKDTSVWRVNALPHPLLSGDQTLCTNDSAIVLKDSSHLYSNVWSSNNNVISTTDSVSVNYTGTFTVHTTNPNTGCSITNTIDVIPAPTPWINDYGWSRVGNCNENTYLFTPNYGTNDIEHYYWDFGDGTTSTYPSPIHTFSNGTDSFTVTFITEKYGVKYNNCNRSIAIHTMVAGCAGGIGSEPPNGGTTGVNNILDDNDIDIYPNPTNGIIHINAKNLLSITVMNLSGKVLLISNKPDFDIKTLNAGMYILRIETAMGISRKKVLKE